MCIMAATGAAAARGSAVRRPFAYQVGGKTSLPHDLEPLPYEDERTRIGGQPTSRDALTVSATFP
jgi:hypothetical protein